MAKLVLAVLLSIIVDAVAGDRLPTCKSCEICVGTIPLREGGCTLPKGLAPPKYDPCPTVTVPPPKICSSFEKSDLRAAGIINGGYLNFTQDAGGKFTFTTKTGSNFDQPVAFFNRFFQVTAMWVKGDNEVVTCFPYIGVSVGDKRVTAILSLWDPNAYYEWRTDNIDPVTGKIKYLPDPVKFSKFG